MPISPLPKKTKGAEISSPAARTTERKGRATAAPRRREAGTGRRAARPAPHSSAFLRSQGPREGGGAAEGRPGRLPGSASPRHPAGARTGGGGQGRGASARSAAVPSYSPGERGRRALRPAPLRPPRPPRQTGAGRPRFRRLELAAAAAADFPARSKLWLRLHSSPSLLPSRGRRRARRPTRRAPGPIGSRTGREGAGRREGPPIRGLGGRARPGPALPGWSAPPATRARPPGPFSLGFAGVAG